MAKTQSTIRLRSNPAGGVTVHGNTIRGVAVLSIGPAKGHGFTVDRTMLKQAAAALASNGRTKCRLSHPDGEDIGLVVAYCENPRIEGDVLRADLIVLDASPHAQYVLQLASTIPNGFGLSIEGQVEFKGTGDNRVARVLEITAVDLVGTPAGNRNGLLSQPMKGRMMEELIAFLRTLGMPEDLTDEAAVVAWLRGRFGSLAPASEGEGGTAVATMSATAVDTAVRAERLRCENIKGIVRGMKLSAAFADQLISEGLSVAEAGVACTRRRMVEDAASTPRFLHGGGEFGGDTIQLGAGRGSDDTAAALQAGCLRLMGRVSLAEKVLGKSAVARAASMGIRNSESLALAACRSRGIDTVGREGESLIRLAFSTASIPNVLAGSLDTIVREAYGEIPQTWRSWTGTPKTLTSLREHTAVRPFLAESAFEDLGPTGELKHGALRDEAFTFRPGTAGKMLSITREHFINDSFNMLGDIVAELGRQAPRRIADDLYKLLLDNPGDFFGEDNANFAAGVDTAFGITAVATAIVKLRKMRDGANRLIGLQPRTLLLPPELEAAGRQILNSTNVTRDQSADQQAAGNPLAGLNLQLEIEARLSDENFHANASPLRWWLFADGPSTAMGTAFLQGQETPTVETADADFNRLGMQARAFIDFAVFTADHRVGVQMEGEAAE